MRVLLALGMTLVAAATAGVLAAGDIPGVEVTSGGVRGGKAGLTLEPGTILRLGTGTSVELAGTTSIEILRGDPAGTCLLAHFGPVSGLYDCAYHALGDTPRFPWQPEAGDRLGMNCTGQAALLLGRKGTWTEVGRGDPDPCTPGPLWVRAPLATPLAYAAIDGVPVNLTPTRVHLPAALAAAVATAVASAAFGVAVWPLLLLPLALLGPAMGLPGAAVASTVVAASATSAALATTAHRRALAVLLGLAAASTAVLVTLDARTPPSSWLATWSATQLIDRELPRHKVDAMVERGRKAASAPRVVIFGSSSSGGSTRGRWWPQILQELLPDVPMAILTEGGATSWHAREVAAALDLHAEVCVTYLGQNDVVVSLPGATLAQLARGEPGTPDRWVAPVTLEEAHENYVALSARCTVLAMEERSLQQGEALARYRDMLLTVPGLHHADAVTALAAEPGVMLDDIHLTPRGAEVLARFVAEKLRPLLTASTEE